MKYTYLHINIIKILTKYVPYSKKLTFGIESTIGATPSEGTVDGFLNIDVIK